MDRGARHTAVHEVTKSWTQLKDQTTEVSGLKDFFCSFQQIELNLSSHYLPAPFCYTPIICTAFRSTLHYSSFFCECLRYFCIYVCFWLLDIPSVNPACVSQISQNCRLKYFFYFRNC